MKMYKFSQKYNENGNYSHFPFPEGGKSHNNNVLFIDAVEKFKCAIYNWVWVWVVFILDFMEYFEY